MHTWLKVLLCVTLVACVSAGALGDTVTWDGGGLDGRWFTDTNWDMDALPAADDDVVDLTDEDIVYDLSDPGNPIDPRVDTFSACGSFADLLTVEANSTLTILSNMHYDVASTGTYTIHVAGASSIVNIGDDITNPNATTSNFTWIVDTSGNPGLPDAQVNVTGIIGQGDWTVFGGVDAGTIHTLDPWLVDDGVVTAETLINITDWTIINGGAVKASVAASVQSAQLSIAGSLEAIGPVSQPARLVVNPTGTVTLTENSKLKADALVVKGVVVGTVGDLVESIFKLDVSGTVDMSCGLIRAGGGLLVSGKIILRDYSAFCGPGSYLTTDADDGVTNPVSVHFVGNGALVYGDPGNKVRFGDNDNPPVNFSGVGSRIERQDVGGVPDPTADLLVTSEISIDIASHVSLEARDWDTTRADLTMAPKDETPIAVEVIAPDDCNIMFVDGNGDLFPTIPCIKYWRNLVLFSRNLNFVDLRDNHVPFGECPGPAFYIVEDYQVNLNDGRLDLMGSALYYGGNLSPADANIIDSVSLSPRVAKLIKTSFGDFNGDCTIDFADRDVLIDAWSGQGNVTDFPLADADGDCDVDVNDLVELTSNYGTDKCWCEDPPGYCSTPAAALDCPTAPPCPLPYGGSDVGFMDGMEVWPVGGAQGVTVLDAYTTYELHYVGADTPPDGYVLLSATNADTIGISGAAPADVEPWNDTGNFEFRDLELEGDTLMPAPGFPEGYAYHQLVVDQTEPDHESELTDGFLCTLTTKGPGDLGLYLLLETSQDDGPILTEASVTFTVVSGDEEVP